MWCVSVASVAHAIIRKPYKGHTYVRTYVRTHMGRDGHEEAKRVRGGMQLFLIEAASGHTIALDAEASDTIGMIKKTVQHEEKIPPDLQCLMSNGKEVDDDRTMTDCNIQEGFRLLLVLPIVEISVKMPAGLTIDAKAEASDTIGDVLRRLSALFQEEVHTPQRSATIQASGGGWLRCKVNGPKGGFFVVEGSSVRKVA